MVHFFFEVSACMATTLELDEELDGDDVMELELEESQLKAIQAPKLLHFLSVKI